MNIIDILLTFIKVFIVGGLICLIAQLLINYTKITAGKILVCFLLAGVILQAFGLYEYLVEFASAGATVPISGFGYLLAKGTFTANIAKRRSFRPATTSLTAMLPQTLRTLTSPMATQSL